LEPVPPNEIIVAPRRYAVKSRLLQGRELACAGKALSGIFE
jgi:hypothetical protein